MNSWLDFEARFRDLIPAFRHIRLTAQTGADGENWGLAGVYDKPVSDQFENLCRLAGEQLTVVCSDDSNYDAILDNSDPLIRWYRAMREQPRVLQNLLSMHSENPDGTKEWTHVGDINDVPETAANMCLELHRTHPISNKVTTKLANRIAMWETRGVDAIKNDLMNHDGIKLVGGSPEVREQAWAWVREQEAKAKKGDVVKPTLFSLPWFAEESNRKLFSFFGAGFVFLVLAVWGLFTYVFPPENTSPKTEVPDIAEISASIPIADAINMINKASKNLNTQGPSLCSRSCLLTLEWMQDSCSLKLEWSNYLGVGNSCTVPVERFNVIRVSQTGLQIEGARCSSAGKNVVMMYGAAQNIHDVLSAMENWQLPDFCLR